MGLYLYCVGGADQPAPDAVVGIDGATVRAIPLGSLLGWASEHDAAPAPTLERVRLHNAVVERATAVATPLPLRFGQWFATEAELQASLADRSAQLERGLRRVRGALEFGVRILDPALHRPEPDRSTGRAYLEGLALRERAADHAKRRGEDVAAKLHDWLGDLVRAQRVRPLGSSDGLAAVAHLVDRHDTGSYHDRVRTFEDRVPGLRLLCSGPWPPYGFVDDD